MDDAAMLASGYITFSPRFASKSDPVFTEDAMKESSESR